MTSRTEILKVVFVPGIAPSKWFRRFNDRYAPHQIVSASVYDPLPYVLQRKADVAFIRLDAEGRDALGEDLHCVELYDEAPGVAAPKDHPISAFKEISMADTEEEIINWQPKPPSYSINPLEVREALDVVAANVGLVIAPRPLIRAFNVKGVKDVALSDGLPTRMAMVWLKERDGELIQNFVGICKGRTSRSSR